MPVRRGRVRAAEARLADQRISVVMPVLNDERALANQADFFELLRSRGHESIVADGGSDDGSARLGANIADRMIETGRGRALQMNAGAAISTGSILWFVHADTRVPERALIELERLSLTGGWGRFDVQIDAPGGLFRLIGTMMNLRSRLSGVATGDQGIFVDADLYRRVGGYPTIALMEDIAISDRLRTQCRPVCLRVSVGASARYWQTHGIVRSILRMWRLRLAYRLGGDPATLHRTYYGRPPA